MKTTRVVRTIGRVLVGAGVLLLLFTAFQLWGTSILESRSQSHLRSQLLKELPKAALKTPAAVLGPPTTGPVTPPPAEGQPVGVMVINKINVNQVVVEGIGTADLRLGPGHYPGTALPGQPGNAAIAGHRTTYGRPFYNLDAMKPGDIVQITTSQGIFVYATQWLKAVVPTEVSVIAPTPGAMLTLTTCNPRFSASQRLVLRAQLIHSRLFGTRPPPVKHHKVARPKDLAGSSGDWLPAVLWGLLVAAMGLGIWAVARKVRLRWLVYLIGALVLLPVLFIFFASISPLLPASY